MSKSIIHGKFADKLHHVPLRLHRNPQRSNAATLQRIASALAEIQAILCNIQRRFFVRLIRRRQTVIESWRHVRQLSCVLVRERFLTRRRGREADPSADQRRSADLIRILQAKFL